MQTTIAKKYQNQAYIQEAESILRACVHCGFCTATCPTYQLFNDELDGPRGRIYLIKDLLEGSKVTKKTQLHLDRCLTCLACETTCPSGVRYGKLIETGRELVEKKVGRSIGSRLQRMLMLFFIPHSGRFRFVLSLGRGFKYILPRHIKNKIPEKPKLEEIKQTNHARKMIIFEGCVQPVVSPEINNAVARVLDRSGISLIGIKEAGCCGAMHHHMASNRKSLKMIRNNIDAWWPHIESGAEAIVMTASGCGVMLKDYGDLLKHDQQYADKAKRISELTRDISEIVSTESANVIENQGQGRKVAFQSPCTLQHGQQITGVVESLLERAGYHLTEVPDSHLCCGSAGTYSLLQPVISGQLLTNKLTALQSGTPEIIATANIGCHMNLAGSSDLPVKHWIELL
ncbi:MAG: glycolate oxidase subunit GlcF [Gammaproteobacteria bacterium]|nr:glycolate oxidase subunit GlcF [Gammaproteobacteria bacterium]